MTCAGGPLPTDTDFETALGRLRQVLDASKSSCDNLGEMDLEPDGRTFRAPDPEGDQLFVRALLGAFLLAAVFWFVVDVLGIRDEAALWSSVSVFVLALLVILYRSAPHEPPTLGGRFRRR